ncbi:hypothetical protein Lesp02_00660 [Lentzea sp. NBRC 105346]|uniref:DUF6282 family protein n=1 Tax=Lentzea sp. NBRC 105346 TaxID=3032205 RepID=UPI0024A4DCC7|nr:DUF6282 family protein [Lentzea sp. NBRC 105346]GLZ27876.1 hypothetical protein Lesp02_00660 [Lentzea sp. NBRC 105346]
MDSFDEESAYLAEAKLRRRNNAPHDRYLSSYRARMGGYRGEVLVPPAVFGVEGAVDLHCHAHEGQQDGLAIAKLASASGIKGLLFKSIIWRHRDDLGGPAAAVREVEDRLRDWCDEVGVPPTRLWAGWIVTDTRGLSMVEQARKQFADGISAVWMPVFSSANTLSKVGGMRSWWGEEPDGWADPLPWEKALKVGHYTLDERGRLKPEYREIFRMAADHDVMISFAHATHPEIWEMAELVRDLGITKAIVDHPFSPFLDLSLEEMRELTSAGIYMNFTYDEISPLLGVDPAEMCRTIQALGTHHVTLSSDAGEPLFPNTVEALRLLRAHMRAFGLTDDEVHETSSINPSKIMNAVD